MKTLNQRFADVLDQVAAVPPGTRLFSTPQYLVGEVLAYLYEYAEHREDEPERRAISALRDAINVEDSQPPRHFHLVKSWRQTAATTAHEGA